MNIFKTSFLVCMLFIVITDARRLLNSSDVKSRFPRNGRISPVVNKPTFLIRSPYRQRTNSNHGFKKKSILHQSLPSYHQGKHQPRTTRIYLNGRVLRPIINPRPSFGYFSTVIHYEWRFTKTFQYPNILNKFTTFQFEEYFLFIFTKDQ